MTIDETVADYWRRMEAIRDPRQMILPTPPTPARRVVGLWAPAPQSGKSTAARALVSVNWEDASIQSFAGPPRSLVAHLLSIMGVEQSVIDERVWQGKRKEEPIPGVGMSAIELLILVGTDVGRKRISDTIWVDAWKRGAEVLFSTGVELVVADDVRFRNEVEAVRCLGGVLIGIRRPGATVSAQRAAAEGHLTFDDMDAVVDNDCPRDEFRSRVLRTARALGVRVRHPQRGVVGRPT